MKRTGAAALVTATAALVATGCGGSTGKSIAKDSKAIDLVPKSAIAYMTVDLDFDGSSWKQVEKLSGAFTDDFTVDKVGEDFVADEKDVDFQKDVKPWLGDEAGAALLSVDTTKDDAEAADWFAWIELDDRAKFEAFAKKQGFTQEGKAGDYELWSKTKNEESFLAVSDDIVVAADSKTKLRSVVEYKGDTILDAKGVDDVVSELDKDDIVNVVLSGVGVRDVIAGDKKLKKLGENKELKQFKGAALGVRAEKDGFRMHGVSKGGASNVKNGGTDLLRDLPGDTLFAVGGNDLGGGIKTALDAAGDADASVQAAVGQFGALLGLDVNELATAFSGEFGLSLAGDDKGLQGLVSAVAGAAMGGGIGAAGGMDPSALAKAAAITLAFENVDGTSAAIDKIAASAGKLTGGGAGKVGKAGDFETKTMSVFGIPVTAASSKDVSALTIGKDVLTTWGTNSLGDLKAFSTAWDKAGAPKDVNAAFWVDYPRIAKLADITTKSDVKPGGWVGWASVDKGDATFDLFMHVDA